MRTIRRPWGTTVLCGAVLFLGTAILSADGVRDAPPGIDLSHGIGPATQRVDLDAYEAVRYVSVNGSDRKGDGLREKPWASLSAALARIKDAGPTRRVAVWVSAGTYRVRALRLKPYVDLYGGFSRKWERADINADATTLDAEGKDRVLIGADQARVDGFTIRGGRAAGHGGAVLCDRTSPALTNNRFQDNATLESPTYLRGIYHQVGTEGGAIACVNYAAPRIEGNCFAANFTEMGGGGAIALRSDSVRPREEIPPPVISRNLFEGNRTGTADTAPDVKKRYRTSNGGAISLSNYLADITNNLFIDNRAGGNGDGGAIYCEYESSPRIANNHFLANRAEDDGAAIYSMKLSEPVIEANVFVGNIGGGSIRISKQGRAKILGNLIYANPAGGVFSNDSWSLVENNVIMDNGGPGFGHQIQAVAYLRPPQVRSNVIRGNKPVEIRAEGPEPAVIENNNIQGGYAGTGNADADPRRNSAARLVKVTSTHYDGSTGITTAFTEDAAPPTDRVRGRVVRSAQGIGVVIRSQGKGIFLWGKMTPGAGTWELLGSYLPIVQ